MGIASGPVTFRRFYIFGNFSTSVTDSFVKHLRDNAFGRYGDATEDGVQVGWIAPTNLFDVDITEEKIAFDRFVLLQIRIDRTAAPGSVVKSYVSVEEQVMREASGKGVLSARERREAREKGVARAEKEANADMFRRMAAVGVLIDLSQRVVYFANCGSAASDKFTTLFRDTFGCSVEPADAPTVAHRIAEAAGDARSVEDAEPFHLVAGTRIADDDDGFDLSAGGFLGREFLTWLWYKIECDEGSFAVGPGSVVVAIAETMRLDCDFKQTGSDVLRCDDPARSPEARAALAIGKQPVKAGLILGGSGGDFSLVFDGPKFNVSSLRIPDSDATDRRARLEERFAHITEAAGLLDSLFALFVGRRSADDFPAELGRMKSWVARQGETAPELTLRFPAEAAAT